MIDPIHTSLTADELFALEVSFSQREAFHPDDFEDVFDFLPGRYFVGDPCYALESDKWDELLNHPTGWFANIKNLGRCIYFDHPQVADDEGKDYPTDSGCIGIVPIDNLSNGHFAALKIYGRIIQFPKADSYHPQTKDNPDPAFSVMTTPGGSIYLGWNWFISVYDQPAEDNEDEEE